MPTEPILNLISFDTCPYAERSRIILEEKELSYKLTLIDLKDKPDWFLEISPRGKVPVLLVDDKAIFESVVINEFLEEAFEGQALLPDDVLERAIARSWIVYVNDVLMAAYLKVFFSKKGEDEKLATGKKEVQGALEKIEKHLASREEGPFFLGKDFGLVDAVVAPIVTRMEASDAVFGKFSGDHPLWEEYMKTILKMETVQVARAENLTEKFTATLENVKA